MDMQRVDLIAGTQCRFEPGAQALDLDPAAFTRILVDVYVFPHGKDLLLTLAASADAHLICDRTLDAFTMRVSGSCRILLTTDEQRTNEATYDETVVWQLFQREFDVTGVARDTLMLAVPTRKVAPHAEDAELPCIFGAAESAPALHWAPLRNLQTDSR